MKKDEKNIAKPTKKKRWRDYGVPFWEFDPRYIPDYAWGAYVRARKARGLETKPQQSALF